MYYFLNHCEITALMTKYGTEDYSEEDNFWRVCKLAELNSANFTQYQQNHRGEIEELNHYLSLIMLDDRKADFLPLARIALFSKRLEKHNPNAISYAEMGNALKIVYETAQDEWQKAEQYERDVEKDLKTIETYKKAVNYQKELERLEKRYQDREKSLKRKMQYELSQFQRELTDEWILLNGAEDTDDFRDVLKSQKYRIQRPKLNVLKWSD